MAIQELRLAKHVAIRGKLVTKSTLRIGGTETGIAIGAAENPVIRDYNGDPYIPGSSLKGKLRSLLELKTGRFGRNGTGWGNDRQGNQVRDGSPCGCGKDDCYVCRVFGPHMNQSHGLGPSRIIVRDAYLTEAARDNISRLKQEGREFSYTKTETMVNRWTGIAADKSLRTQESVPAGTEFALEMSLRVFKDDDERAMVEFVKTGLGLLEKDTLGGSGTRGYGWVEVRDIEVIDP